MAWKRVEDGISALLKEELQKLGVVADLTPSLTTPAGLRKPDLLCRNGGVYPVEAKFIERDLIVAIAKVQNDYLKYHKILGIKGGFAILYPEQLSQPMPEDAFKDLAFKLKFKLVSMFPPEDPRPFKVYESQLSEIAKTLYEHIFAIPKVEPSIDYIISSLRQSALYLLNGLKHLSSKELEGFFGGEEVFKNILQYEEGKYPVEELKLAAAYLLVNQLLFYHALSRLRSEFTEIDSDNILKPSDLNQYFEKVLEVNYKMVFSYDVASLIPPKFLQEVRTIINVIGGLGTQKVGGDLLGTIFHDLIPFETRKNVAAFYTNVLAAELLAFVSIDKQDSKVADFAAGSGGLLVAAYRRKRSLLKEPFAQETHRRFVQEELLGIDVMPFAANVAACHLALQAPQFFTDRVNMAIWDSTDLRPNRRIPSVAELKTVLSGQAFLDTYIAPKKEAKGLVSLGQKRVDEVSLDTYDTVIMNPPFTRQERIPEEYKRILLTRFDDYKEYLHGQLGFYGYFVLLADRFLNDGGRMALVLPATVLRVRSCEGLRKLWAEKYHVEHIVTTWHRSAFSESVLFRETLLVARKTKLKGDEKTAITVLKNLPSTLSEARETAKQITGLEEAWEDDKTVVKIYDYSELKRDIGNWFKYVAVSDLSLVDLMEELLKSDKLVSLSSISEALESDLRHYKFMDFHGFVIYDKSRALKRIDSWILEKISVRLVVAKHRDLGWEAKIPVKVLSRGLRRASYVDTIDVSDTSDYLILSWFEGIEDMAKTALTDRELQAFRKTGIESWQNSQPVWCRNQGTYETNQRMATRS
jgi:type I restriction-modification system DNA methylase subunit